MNNYKFYNMTKGILEEIKTAIIHKHLQNTLPLPFMLILKIEHDN